MVLFPKTKLTSADAKRIRTATPKPNSVKIATDDLAVGRSQHIVIVHTGLFQQRAGQVVGLLEAINIVCDIANSIIESNDYRRDVELQAITDTIALYDAVFVGSVNQVGAPIPPAIEIWNQPSCDPMVKALGDLQSEIDTGELDYVRDIRNRIGAHIDSSSSMHDLVALIDRADLWRINRLMLHLATGVSNAMNTVMLLRHFLVHGQIMNGVIGLAKDYSTPFDDR